ncbi:MAG TPA: hypothetical protein VI300_05985 [Solirubrobacter sp.]
MIAALAALALAFAAPGQGPVALARAEGDSPVALAGGTALFRRGETFHLRVLSVPVDGSAAARELIRLPGAQDVEISASPQRAAFAFFSDRDAYVLTGPPAGPFQKAPTSQGGGSPPYYATVNHDNLFTVEEAPGDPFAFRHVAIEPGMPPRPLGLPGDANLLAYDGDLIAYNRGDTNVTVHDWRTGAERTIVLPDLPNQFDVRADGSLVASTYSGIYTVAPDGPPVLLARRGERAQFAGERIVYASSSVPAGRARSLYAVDADGHARKIGVPSMTLGNFIPDADRVLWTANGCLLVADLAAPLAAAPQAGPCPRSEVGVIGTHAPIRSDRTVRLRLRCVAAPRACRGTFQLKLVNEQGGSSSVRFSIPAGGRTTLSPRLTRAGYAAARRDPNVELSVEGVTVDPGGRRHRFRLGASGRLG